MAQVTHNLDIAVPEQISNQYPRLAAILNNPEMNLQFSESDATANRGKLLFVLFGLLSLVLMVLMLLIVVWHPFLVELSIKPPGWLRWAGAGAGILSLLISFTSRFVFRFQKKWLYGRYVTERLRQWKFQQLLDGVFIDLSLTEPHAFERDLANRWVTAKFEVMEKPGAMDDFLDAENFSLFVKPSVCERRELEQEVTAAYQTLRMDYQAKYFSFKKHVLEALDVWTNGIAKLTFLLAGLLALSEITIGFFETTENEILMLALGVSALSLALLSIAVRIFRSARAMSEESERYSSKWVRLRTLVERFQSETEPAKRLESMIETERVCVEELREFIRTFRKSDYLL
ncbi:MAG TPA: hypothetical protein VIT88_04980 [Pyrinomonadaceae bacterium]